MQHHGWASDTREYEQEGEASHDGSKVNYEWGFEQLRSWQGRRLSVGYITAKRDQLSPTGAIRKMTGNIQRNHCPRPTGEICRLVGLSIWPSATWQLAVTLWPEAEECWAKAEHTSQITKQIVSIVGSIGG